MGVPCVTTQGVGIINSSHAEAQLSQTVRRTCSRLKKLQLLGGEGHYR
eukprot:COSAG01_NODE_2170_length_8236_cov_17.597272_10_plen_48_part_00